MNSLPEQIIIDILRTRMSLTASQIWIRSQNRLIPPTDGLFIVVGSIDSKPISVTNTPISTDTGMKELIQAVMRENIQIDILSRNNSALQRRVEILLALKSLYSLQKQEEEEFSIFNIPSVFANTSVAEGGSNINRFTIVVACHTWYREERNTSSTDEYYDNFNTRVDDEDTIEEPTGLIEFNIHGDEVS